MAIMTRVSALTRSRIFYFILLLIGVVTIGNIVASNPSHLQRVSSFTSSISSSLTSNKKEEVSEGEEPWNIPFYRDTPQNLAIANSTLGFEKIFVLGLPDRTFKHDGMELAASVTNLNLTWVDGVAGDKMHEGSVPPYHNNPNAGFFKTDGELGCWRGHMNIVQKMVTEKISTALIMEDDADWDVHIALQMQKFANTSRTFLTEDPNEKWQRKRRAKTNSPYGEGWDILWVGHCGGWPAKEGNYHTAVVKNDSTVPPLGRFYQVYDIKKAKNPVCSTHAGNDPSGVTCDAPRLAEDERVIEERTSPLCTTGYAISLQGAKKMLARLGGLSLEDVQAPVDWSMINMCKENGRKGADREASRCLTVSPPYIRTFRAKGPASGDSDIQGHAQNANDTREVAISEGLSYPARMNVENLISGNEPEMQFLQENGRWRYKTKDEYRTLP